LLYFDSHDKNLDKRVHKTHKHDIWAFLENVCQGQFIWLWKQTYIFKLIKI
jgi:hypothetical protein